MEIGHEIFYMVIHLLPLIQEGLLSVSMYMGGWVGRADGRTGGWTKRIMSILILRLGACRPGDILICASETRLSYYQPKYNGRLRDCKTE